MEDVRSNNVFAEQLIHEMIHFKSYGSLLALLTDSQNDKERKLTYQYSRIGLEVQTEQKELFFNLLNEAVTEELTKRLFQKGRRDAHGRGCARGSDRRGLGKNTKQHPSV